MLMLHIYGYVIFTSEEDLWFLDFDNSANIVGILLQTNNFIYWN